MNRKQLLLFILGVVLVGIIGACNQAKQFDEKVALTAHDVIISDLNNLGANALEYFIKPTVMNGGGHSYVNYKIPNGLDGNAIGTYSIIDISPCCIQFRGTSVAYPGNYLSATYDSTGKLIGTLDNSSWNPGH